MSLLLDALERAERSRREQRGQGRGELELEALPGTGSAPENPSFQADAGSLFELQSSRASPGLPRSGWVALAAIVVLTGTAGWLLTGSDAGRAMLGRNAPPAVPNLAPPAAPGVDSRPALPAKPSAAAVLPADHAPDSEAVRPGPDRLRKSIALHAGNDRPTTDAGVSADGAHRAAEASGSAGRVAAQGGPALQAPGQQDAAQPDAGRPASARQDAAQADAAYKTAVAPVDIQLFRNPQASPVDPALLAAWKALQDGRPDEALAGYQKLERSQPANPDVQLGLATLAAQQGQTAEARTRYLRVLALDPLNHTAQTGLAILDPEQKDQNLDSRLRSAAAASVPGAEFALATRLSATGQWPEAEQAWFETLRSDPTHPDLLYNLAIALDHLHQTTAAVQYYQQALQAADKRPGHFHRDAVTLRLRQLGAR